MDPEQIDKLSPRDQQMMSVQEGKEISPEAAHLKEEVEGIIRSYEAPSRNPNDKRIVREMKKIKENLEQGSFTVNDGKIRMMMEPPVSVDIQEYMRDLAIRTGHESGQF